MNFTRRGLVTALALLAAGIGGASAQERPYPTRPITIIVPWAPGNSTDIVTRRLGNLLAQRLGQPVVVENRPGASGFLGTVQSARAPADGYTLLMASSGTHAAAVSLFKKLDFDPLKDFQPISRVVSFPNVAIVGKSHPAKTIQEFVALAKAKPGKMAYASTGTGNSVHLAAELFKAQTGTDLLEVPYKLTGTALIDVQSARVDVMFANIQVAYPQIEGGTMRALAVTGTARSAILPNVPAISELGFPNYNVTSWMGLMGPAGMPQDVVNRLAREVGVILADPKFIEANLKEGSAMYAPDTPAQFAAFLRDEVARWRDIIKTAGVKPE
jgi:tripartite-type tricarboxylate transporter receptor subunit TctC